MNGLEMAGGADEILRPFVAARTWRKRAAVAARWFGVVLRRCDGSDNHARLAEARQGMVQLLNAVPLTEITCEDAMFLCMFSVDHPLRGVAFARFVEWNIDPREWVCRHEKTQLLWRFLSDVDEDIQFVGAAV